jgi:hypothetical protein
MDTYLVTLPGITVDPVVIVARTETEVMLCAAERYGYDKIVAGSTAQRVFMRTLGHHDAAREFEIDARPGMDYETELAEGFAREYS